MSNRELRVAAVFTRNNNLRRVYRILCLVLFREIRHRIEMNRRAGVLVSLLSRTEASPQTDLRPRRSCLESSSGKSSAIYYSARRFFRLFKLGGQLGPVHIFSLCLATAVVDAGHQDFSSCGYGSSCDNDTSAVSSHLRPGRGGLAAGSTAAGKHDGTLRQPPAAKLRGLQGPPRPVGSA
jgi:hypothetical protein